MLMANWMRASCVSTGGHAVSRAHRRLRWIVSIAAMIACGLLAAPPASASSLPAPVLAVTSNWCTATLDWTHDNPNDVDIYNFQYRISADRGVTWPSWNNISGGDAARTVTVAGVPDGGDNTFQVRATGIAPGRSIFGDPSNSVTVPMLSPGHIQCQ